MTGADYQACCRMLDRATCRYQELSLLSLLFHDAVRETPRKPQPNA